MAHVRSEKYQTTKFEDLIPDERNLKNVFSSPFSFPKDISPEDKKDFAIGFIPKFRMPSFFAQRRSPFDVFKNFEHEFDEGIPVSPNSRFKMVKFNSEINSEKKAGDLKPKVSGFSSGLKVQSRPGGKLIIQKFESPIGQRSLHEPGQYHRKQSAFNNQPTHGRLNIEPAINLQELKSWSNPEHNQKSVFGNQSTHGRLNIEPAINIQELKSWSNPEHNQKNDINRVFSQLFSQEQNHHQEPSNEIRFPHPQNQGIENILEFVEPHNNQNRPNVFPSHINIDNPAKNENDGHELLEMLLGNGASFQGLPQKVQKKAPPKVILMRSFGQPQNQFSLSNPSSHQNEEAHSENFLEELLGGFSPQAKKIPVHDIHEKAHSGNFLEELLGGFSHQAKRNPVHEIHEEVNPLEMILGLQNPHQSTQVHHQKHSISHTKISKKSHKVSKSHQLENFLGDILNEGKRSKKITQPKVLVAHPKVNETGLHSGVQKLLDLIESSEKNHLINPVNEPSQENPLEGILGANAESPESGILQQLLQKPDNSESQGANILEQIMGKSGNSQSPGDNIFEQLIGKQNNDQSSNGGFLEQLLGSQHPNLKAHSHSIHHKTTKIHHQINIHSQSGSPAKNNLQNLPNSYKMQHIPLMNSFYHLKELKNRTHPVRYPPLGHKKSTLLKIRNNVFNYPEQKKCNYHRKSGKFIKIKPTEVHIASKPLKVRRYRRSHRRRSHKIDCHHRPRHSSKRSSHSQHTHIKISTHYKRKSHRRHKKSNHRADELFLNDKMENFIENLLSSEKNSDDNFII